MHFAKQLDSACCCQCKSKADILLWEFPSVLQHLSKIQGNFHRSISRRYDARAGEMHVWWQCKCTAYQYLNLYLTPCRGNFLPFFYEAEYLIRLYCFQIEIHQEFLVEFLALFANFVGNPIDCIQWMFCNTCHTAKTVFLGQMWANIFDFFFRKFRVIKRCSFGADKLLSAFCALVTLCSVCFFPVANNVFDIVFAVAPACLVLAYDIQFASLFWHNGTSFLDDKHIEYLRRTSIYILRLSSHSPWAASYSLQHRNINISIYIFRFHA